MLRVRKANKYIPLASSLGSLSAGVFPPSVGVFPLLLRCSSFLKVSLRWYLIREGRSSSSVKKIFEFIWGGKRLRAVGVSFLQMSILWEAPPFHMKENYTELVSPPVCVVL